MGDGFLTNFSFENDTHMVRKKAAKKKNATTRKAAKKPAAKKKPTKVIDEPAKTVFYKQGDLIDGFEVLEEAAARTKKKDPMPFDIKWETSEAEITLHILGAVTLEKKGK
jgi:hypothetical protein